MEIIHATHSVCPVCLKRIDADIVRFEDTIRLVKTCHEHGLFGAVIWRAKPDFASWGKVILGANDFAHTSAQATAHITGQSDCPHACGLCAGHKQRSCTVLFEITHDCNLHCPVCFANASPASTKSEVLPLERALEQITWIHKQAGAVVLQISGGEPTLYPYLIEVVQAASKLFPAVQINTNGIVLAEQPSMAKALKDAGVSWIFLQFDGDNDAIYTQLRGQALLETKRKAIEHCKEAGLAVILVATVVAGVNDTHLGNLLRYGLALFPTVRGIHLQPMTLSGRNNFHTKTPNITLPEVITKLSEQSQGFIQVEHALPSSCEHVLCSFHCRYYVDEAGNLEYVQAKDDCGCEAMIETSYPKAAHNDAPQRSIESVIRSWQGDSKEATGHAIGQILTAKAPLDAFDVFIAKARNSVFSVTCMAFQDVHTLDLERLQKCCVHVYDGHDRLIPFCAYNLTSLDDVPLYRR